jgi:hypothetical protein
MITLLECLSQDADQQVLEGYGLAEWRGLLETALLQGLAPLLYKRLVKEGRKDKLPGEVAAVLRDSYLNCLGHNLVIFNELHKVLVEFQKNGIPTLLLKGSYLANFVYQDIGLRDMSDVDLMVGRSNLPAAIEILRGSGYSGAELPLTAEELDTYKHAPVMEKPGLITIELHWTLADKDEGLKIDEQDLWQRAEPVRIDHVEALALSPEDLILHTGIHATYSHRLFRQARSIVDLAEILNKEGGRVNWETVIDQANQWQAGRGVFLMLYLAQRYLNAAVPAYVLTNLQPVDFDPSIIEDIFCLFCQKEPPISDLFIPLIKRSWPGKVSAFLQTAFPPRLVVGRIYHVEVRSWRLFVYYPMLWRDKLIHGWDSAKRLLVGRNDTGRSLNALYNIQTWLQIPGFKERP